VPAASPYVLRDFALRRLDGVAGTVGIRILSGGPVDVAVLSAGATDGPDEMLAMMNGPKVPGDGHNRTGVFDLNAFAESTSTISYAAGADDASVTYGAHTPPAAEANTNGHDYGEYGVLRSITFDLTNPSPQPATVYLYERPMGGVVRSSFLVDGSLIQVGCARVSDRYQISSIALDAGATRRVNVLTTTDGGSNYPIEVGVTSTPPEPSTPPISAPNGCFPKPQPAASPVPSPSPAATPPL
jgi:FlaG/FlaF family flagellin (archaellin)